MYSKDNVKEFLLKQLTRIAKMNLPYSTRKVVLNDSGYIVTISNEKMIPIDYYNLGIFKAGLSESEDQSLINFLLAYIAKVKSLNFIIDEFEDLFHEFLLFINEGKYVYRTIGLINGLNIDKKQINLQDFSIRTVDKESIEYFYNMIDEYYNTSNINLKERLTNHMPNATVLIEKNQTLSDFKEFKSIRNNIEKLSLGILLNNGVINPISFSPIVTFSYFDQYGLPKMTEFINKVGNNQHRHQINFLDLNKLKNQYNKIKVFNNKFIALERLASAHNKLDFEDKFIDLMIALESLYPSITSEVTYRISLYTAILLGKSKETFKSVKKLYKTRSKLVHGTSSLTHEQLIGELKHLDDIVRRVIIKSLKYDSLQDMEMTIEKELLPN